MANKKMEDKNLGQNKTAANFNGDKIRQATANNKLAPQIRVLSESAMAPVYDNLDVAKMAAIARSNATSDIDLQFTGVQSP